MKNTCIFLSLILCLSVSAQVRTSLYEEFTSENYGIWYPTNPNLNTLLLNNSSLVIPIKWQVPLPTAPTNVSSLYQTNKAEINWRSRSSSGTTALAAPGTLGYGYPSQNTATDVPTNGINSGLTGRLDGQHQWAFGANSDDPADVTSAVIISAQTQTTNFRTIMIPSWSPTFTNCVVSVTVTSTTPFTALGALMYRLCLVEREINFATSPGINGEKNFYDVVRRSYPTTLVGSSVTAMGTPLPGTWIAGQSQTFTVNCNIPASIRDLSQMAFVGFVQDDGDRKVYQAERSPKPAIPNDIDVVSLNVPLSCTGAFTPTFVVQNLGPVAVAALTIAPYIDGVAQTVFNYAGSIAGGASATITLASYTAAYGKHTFSTTVTGVSGGDINLVNNTTKVAFGVSNNVLVTGVSQPFATFPPANWYVLNYDFEPATWGLGAIGAYGTSPTCAKFDFYNILGWGGESDDLFFPVMDLTAVSNAVLSFDVAYAQYTNQNDRLDVMASTNCGSSWTNVYTKQGSVLATAPSFSTGAFVPSSSQWRTETINLPALSNQSSVLLKFVATSDFGNNLYVDNVNIGSPQPPIVTSITKVRPNTISCMVFPNPSSDLTQLSIRLPENETVEIKIMNSIGQVVYVSANNKLNAGDNIIRLTTENLASGVYFVNIASPKAAVTTKLSVAK